jgi:hypothetical protein
MRSIFQSYQPLTRFVRDRCESEQEISKDLNEAWLAERVRDFARERWSRFKYRFDWFSPEEFRTGRPGGAHRMDYAAFRKEITPQTPVSLVAELKLMKAGGANWAQEILCDLFRVACIRKRTTNITHRLVLVVGQEQCWDNLQDKCDGLIRNLCPIDRRHQLLTAGLTNIRYTTNLDRWKPLILKHVDEYLHPHLPQSIGVEIVGLSKSSRGVDEHPELGMSARLWRVYPKGAMSLQEVDSTECATGTQRVKG